jgi:hypothetical protein
MPYALGGTALLVIGQFATVKLDFQHFAECRPLILETANAAMYPRIAAQIIHDRHLFTAPEGAEMAERLPRRMFRSVAG